MNSFDACRGIEAQSRDILGPYLDDVLDDGRYVLTDKGRLAKELQCRFGDIIAQKNGNVICIELKAEQNNAHGNFFIEEWSNLNPDADRWTLGWFYKLDSDFLFYHFIDNDELYIIDFRKLKRWALLSRSPKTRELGVLHDYPLKDQGKRKQLNVTWGRCVPITHILKAVPHRAVNPRTFKPLQKWSECEPVQLPLVE